MPKKRLTSQPIDDDSKNWIDYTVPTDQRCLQAKDSMERVKPHLLSEVHYCDRPNNHQGVHQCGCGLTWERGTHAKETTDGR